MGRPEATNEAYRGGRDGSLGLVGGEKNALLGHSKGGKDVNRGKPTWVLFLGKKIADTRTTLFDCSVWFRKWGEEKKGLSGPVVKLFTSGQN